jgi:hypothetical protein
MQASRGTFALAVKGATPPTNGPLTLGGSSPTRQASGRLGNEGTEPNQLRVEYRRTARSLIGGRKPRLYPWAIPWRTTEGGREAARVPSPRVRPGALAASKKDRSRHAPVYLPR